MGVVFTADLCDIHNQKCIVFYIKVKVIEQRIKNIPFKVLEVVSSLLGSGLGRGKAYSSSESDFERDQSRQLD